MSYDWIVEKAIGLAIQLLTAGLVLFIGFKLVNFFEKKVFGKRSLLKLDDTLKNFLHSVMRFALKALIIVLAINVAGVPMTTFIAILGAAGLAVGLALQGSLSNLAAGVLIIALRPFKVGDFVDGAGHSGTVSEIGLFYTRFTTPDNRAIILPNSALSSSSIVNYGYFESRRLDLDFGVDYGSDIAHVKRIILKVIESHPLALMEPEPFVRLSEHADSALIFRVRVWTQTADYWALHFDLKEQVKEAFDREGIEIPYPHVVIENKKTVLG